MSNWGAFPRFGMSLAAAIYAFSLSPLSLAFRPFTGPILKVAFGSRADYR